MFYFHKYQGTGNDFVIIDAITQPDAIELTQDARAQICDRRYGIGADGLILLSPSDKADFKMIYYNSDGNESSMCGNGGRCISQFAFREKYASKEMTFEAIDGIHHSEIKNDSIVSLEMGDVDKVNQVSELAYVLDTGSPHYVYFDVKGEKDIVNFGKEVRYSDHYKKEGINVNLVQWLAANKIKVQTYERGVEAETLSCGTGVTACVLSSVIQNPQLQTYNSIEVETKGGMLTVGYKGSSELGFTEIQLIGPATEVFRGYIAL